METLNPLANLDLVTMDKDQAMVEYEKYKAVVARSHAAADRLMARCYKELSEGRGVLNLPAAMKTAGCDEKTWLPRLAVSRADQPEVFFKQDGWGGANFSFSSRYYMHRRIRKAQNARLQFSFPEGTFARPGAGCYPTGYYDIHRTAVPPIPPEYRPADAFSKYCILWEPSVWDRVAPPDDPVLLRPLGAGLYVVLAQWDLTEVEKLVLGALAGN